MARGEAGRTAREGKQWESKDVNNVLTPGGKWLFEF